ncbi:MAG: glutathione S-transferase family protein [Burkholderiales bacterium]|nr:glutathione S-transferase family protein [Burkholderiales bacterium]
MSTAAGAKPVLYHNDMSVCAAKVRMALAEKAVEYDGVHLNLRAGDAQKPDYVKLNPNQVVPTLVHADQVIIESNVICEYVDDAWPDAPLRPAAPADRARMRLWMRQLDEGVHAATGTISSCIAFRHQHLQRDPAELQAWLERMTDPARRERTRHAIELGVDAPEFAPAVRRFQKLLGDMDTALAGGAWLAGPTYSLADLAYAPYMTRLDHLGLAVLIDARPRVRDWAGRLFARPAYAQGIAAWFNPSYLEIFARERAAAGARVATIIAQSG